MGSNPPELQRDCRYVQKDRRVSFPYQDRRGDLVVMDIETFNRGEKMLKLREELLERV